MKITAAVFALMPAALQQTFTIVPGTSGDSAEYDNGEESATGLKTALEKEKAEAKAAKERLTTYEAGEAAKLEAARKKAVEDARANGDFAAVEKDYQQRIKALEDQTKAAAKEREESIKNTALDKAAGELAKRFVSPSLATPAIKSRLKVEIVEGEPIVRVLSKDGKASGLALTDLEKEFLTDPEMKGSIRAGQGSGGGSGHPIPSGGSGGESDKKFNAVEASPAEMIARLESKPGFNTDGDD